MRIDIQDLRKSYGTKVALDIPGFTVQPGEAVGLVGSNGAGKTTFLRLMLDLIKADAGSVSLGGHRVAEYTAWKHATGSYLDDAFLIDYLTPDEYLAFVGSLYGLTRHETRMALVPYRALYADEVLGKTTKFIKELSMGNAKKLGVIAAMFITPKLLILDEPFANLDPPSQIRLKQHLVTLNEQYGTTLFISSHDLGHVTTVCKRIAVLEQGLIVRDMPTSAATQQELEQYFTTTSA